MSETKWTRGTWQVMDRKIEQLIVSDGWHIATVPFLAKADMQMDRANARLIAAAPELYEALEECKRVLSDLQSTQLEGTRTRNAWDKARAALAKARGE